MKKLGCIGQGWIGKNLSDHFEERGFEVVRYAMTPEFESNRDAISACDIVFIAVPTPSTPEGFDASILEDVIGLVGTGKIAVIKSTVLPGTTDRIARMYPEQFVLHAPEFLRETSVRHDIDHPDRHIIGIPRVHFDEVAWQDAARAVLEVLPPAPYQAVCSAAEAELTKYGGNNFLYTKVVFMNMLYDLAMHHGARFEEVAQNMAADPRIGTSHMRPVHQYDHMGALAGRGAGGHCFIKDFAALREQYVMMLPHDTEGIALLRALEAKNNRLLRDSGKDLDLLHGVYGKLGDDMALMQDYTQKEKDDITAMERAYEKHDLATLAAAYERAGRDLAELRDAYVNAGGDLRALSALDLQA